MQKYPTTLTGLRQQLRMSPEEVIVVDTTAANILLNPEETVILVLRAISSCANDKFILLCM